MKVQRFPIYSMLLHVHNLPYYQHSPRTGTFVATGESTLTHHNYPNYTVAFLFHAFYEFGQVYNDMCPNFSIIFTAQKNLLCSGYSSPIPQLLMTTDIFTISIVLPFPECHELESYSIESFQTSVFNVILCT